MKYLKQMMKKTKIKELEEFKEKTIKINFNDFIFNE